MDVAMLVLHSSPLDALGARDAGGMSVVLQELSAALARRGHRVDLFTCRGDSPPGEPVALTPGVRLVRLEAKGAASAPKEALYRHVRAAAAEVIRFAEDAGRAYSLVHSHYWVSGSAGQEVAGAWRVPHLVTFHTLGAAKNRLACGEDVSPRRLEAERHLTANADRILVPSAREARVLTESYGDPGDRLAVVGWGVDHTRFCPGDRVAAREEVGVKHDVRALLFVGRHVPVKGLDLLLAALPEVAAYQPQVRLLVAGGDAASAVEGDSAGRVTWLGPVARERLPLLYRSVDALVVPSRYESFGLVVLEALACGTPVIATRVGVVDEVVCDGVNGRRADVPAPDALARAILEQLESEPPSPAAIRDSVARWSWERTGMAIEGVYREVVEHGG